MRTFSESKATGKYETPHAPHITYNLFLDDHRANDTANADHYT